MQFWIKFGVALYHVPVSDHFLFKFSVGVTLLFSYHKTQNLPQKSQILTFFSIFYRVWSFKESKQSKNDIF